MTGRPRGAWGALCLLVPGVAVAADNAQLAACAAARPRAAIEAMALCRKAYDDAVSTHDARTATDALLERIEAGIALARYDDALADLDLAQATSTPLGDWHDTHRLERQRGIVAYRREQLADAALHFSETLALARAQKDPRAQAQSLNDMGNAYRRTGDFAQALESFTASLALREALGETEAAAAVLNNLGNVSQDLGDYAAAQDWLERALAIYRKQDAPRSVAHVLESLALNDRHAGRDEAARTKFVEAWNVFEAQGATRDQLRVATQIARLSSESAHPDAASWIARADALAGKLSQPPPLRLALAQARTEPAARKVLRERLLAGDDAPTGDRVDAWRFLAETSERDGDAVLALADFKAYNAAALDAAERAQNERVAQWQVRLDVATKLRELAALRDESRVQALRTKLVLAIALCVAIALAAAFVLHLQRVRAQRRALERQTARYREAADALRADRSRLQALVDSSDEALLLVDAQGIVLAANRAAATRFGDDALRGRPLRALAGEPAGAIVDAIAAAEADSAVPGASVEIDIGGTRLRAASGLLDDPDLEEPLGWVRLFAASTQAGATEAAPPIRASAGDDAPEVFRRALVELMQASLQAWERSTRTTRVDFAEKSGIWRVHVDDGRLRMRSMERYLSVAKLPRHPRWREVLRSAYFVLAECALGDAERAQLERLVEAVRAQVTDKALA